MRERIRDPRVWNSGQTWNFESLWQIGGVFTQVAGIVVRVKIERDAYDAQSKMTVELFDPASLRWNEVVRRPMTPKAGCYKISYVQTEVDVSNFAEDEVELLREATAVLKAAGRET